MPLVEVLIEVPGGLPEIRLTEHVPAEMLCDGHYAEQLVERMGWALLDAEQEEDSAREVRRSAGPASIWLDDRGSSPPVPDAYTPNREERSA